MALLSTRRITGLNAAQISKRADRPLGDVARRHEGQRRDRVLVGRRLRLLLAPAECFLEERLHGRASVEWAEGDHADRFGRLLFSLADELVAQVFARERDGPAVVVLDDLVLPQEARGTAEHRPAEDQPLRDEVFEQPEALGTKLGADHDLIEFLLHESFLSLRVRDGENLMAAQGAG